MEKQNLFLDYINAPLHENPAHFLEVCDAIEKSIKFTFGSAEYFNIVAKFVILFAHKNRPKLVDHAYECKDGDFKNQDLQRIIINAGEAVFGYRNNYCETTCSKRKHREEIFGREVFSGDNRLRCFQCEQMGFIFLIDELISGKEFGEISGFLPFINLGNRYLEFVIKDVPADDKKNVFKTKLEKHIEFQPDHPFYLRGDSNGKFAFLNFLNCLVSYSLAEFLFGKDRRKIKKCLNCDQYYIAKTVKAKQKYCSDRCKTQNHWTREKWNEYMRNYRKMENDELAKRKDEFYEKEIRRFMEQLDVPREEAIGLMKDDPAL